MDLWIRTQNREKLINVAYIDVSQLNEIGEYRLGGDGMFIGKYKSKERALEVLDEIQEILANNFRINSCYEEADLLIKAKILANMCRVYEMPKE